MQIYGTSQLHGAQALSGPHATARSNSAGSIGQSSGASDELHLSEAGQLAAKLSDIPDIRQDRVSALRAAIQSGTYETTERLTGAVNNLLDEIG